MESLLMNIIGVAAIVAMLCGIWIMWSNIDRELAKIEKAEAAKSGLKRKAENGVKSAEKKCGRAVNAIPAPCHTASFERVALSKLNCKPRAELKLA